MKNGNYKIANNKNKVFLVIGNNSSLAYYIFNFIYSTFVGYTNSQALSLI